MAVGFLVLLVEKPKAANLKRVKTDALGVGISSDAHSSRLPVSGSSRAYRAQPRWRGQPLHASSPRLGGGSLLPPPPPRLWENPHRPRPAHHTRALLAP